MHFSNQKKRKQHYVWEHYLTAWASNGQIWCLRDGNIFKTNTDNVANRRDFYRLKQMTPNDLKFVKAMAVDIISNPIMREMAEGWIPTFTQLFAFKEMYDASGQRDPLLDERLEVLTNNLEEELHGQIEARAIPVLDALKNTPKSLFEDGELLASFTSFIATQYFRTPAIAARVARSLNSKGSPPFNLEAAWGLMRTIYATTVGASLYCKQNSLRISILSTPTSAEFITGDQPAVNIRSIGLREGEAPTEFELFYPLSPHQAALFYFDAPSQELVTTSLSVEEVASYNTIVSRASREQMYGSSKESLEFAIV